jgi:hypothetical protein
VHTAITKQLEGSVDALTTELVIFCGKWGVWWVEKQDNGDKLNGQNR